MAIATLVAGGATAEMKVVDIKRDSMLTAFAAYADTHEAASVRRGGHREIMSADVDCPAGVTVASCYLSGVARILNSMLLTSVSA